MTDKDRRIRKTRQVLRQSFASLLAEKPLEDITVKELTERSDINRGTFYCHYKDIYDLKDQIERELFDEFVAVIDGYGVDNLRRELRSVMTDVFRFLQRNKEFGTIISAYKTDSLFFAWVRSEIFRRGLSEWQRIYGFQDSIQWDYYLDFVVAGCVTMLQSWIQKGMRESPEEMGALSERFILYGPGEVLGLG